MKSKRTVIYSLILLIGVILLLNIISRKFFFRLDFTEDNRYTLSNATKELLIDLPETVTIKVYLTKNLPSQIAHLRRDLKELLLEYSILSDQRIIFEFIDPKDKEGLEQELQKIGINPFLIGYRENDEMSQKETYLSMMIELGEQQEIIPFINPGMLEYTLSSSIKKLSVVDKPIVGLLQGHGEPSVNSLQPVISSLNIMYHVEPFQMKDTAETDLSRYQTIAIVNPMDTIPPFHLGQLDQYLAKGGKLFIAYNNVDGDFSSLMGNATHTGLTEWLKLKGIEVGNNFIIDQNCGQVNVQQNAGFMKIMQPVPFPFLPVMNDFADHPVTKGLESVIFQFASSIKFTGDSSINYTPLVKSSKNSGTKSVPVYFDIREQHNFPMSGIVAAAAFKGKLIGDIPSKLVVVTDGDFPINGQNEDNIHLMVNSIDWLSDDTGLIELRTKGISSRPIEQLEDSNRKFLKWFNFSFPIFLILVIGIIIMQYKRNIRIKRMEEGYV
ncbi:MAG: GldG family protein [bacterium]